MPAQDILPHAAAAAAQGRHNKDNVTTRTTSYCCVRSEFCKDRRKQKGQRPRNSLRCQLYTTVLTPRNSLHCNATSPPPTSATTARHRQLHAAPFAALCRTVQRGGPWGGGVTTCNDTKTGGVRAIGSAIAALPTRLAIAESGNCRLPDAIADSAIALRSQKPGVNFGSQINHGAANAHARTLLFAQPPSVPP